jgi:hypothetical protein
MNETSNFTELRCTATEAGFAFVVGPDCNCHDQEDPRKQQAENGNRRPPDTSAAVLDARPESSDHTPSRPPRLKLRSLPFLFYATHPQEDVTTVRGALIV